MKAARKRAGMSGRALAKFLLCSERTVFYLESGQREPPIRMAHAIQKKFGIPIVKWSEPANDNGKDAA